MARKPMIGLLVTVLMLCGIYVAWCISQPVRVDAVHREGGASHVSVLVSNFPWTDRGRINWWLQNKERIKIQFGIPAPDADGSFEIVFWAWDGIYRIDHGADEDSDLRCFNDMQEKANCIVKNDIPLQVSRLKSGITIFDIGWDDRRVYSQSKEGDEPKRRRDWEKAENEGE